MIFVRYISLHCLLSSLCFASCLMIPKCWRDDCEVVRREWGMSEKCIQ